jgi:hypothetical protein
MHRQTLPTINNNTSIFHVIPRNTTTFLTFRNSRKPWPKVQKPLPKPLSSGFPGVGYTAVAFSNRQRFFTFQQRILAAVALHMKRQRLLYLF